MKHPLEFVPGTSRKPIFFTLLFLTLILFGVFRVLDAPLRTPAAPNGIVSFELARTPARAQSMIDVWTGRTVIYTDGEHSNAVTTPPGEPFLYKAVPIIHAAFGLGLDYLFMPLYAFALAFGTLLAASRHAGWLKSLGAVAGYGAFAAAVFDAMENYALLQVLLDRIQSPYPEIAFYCASAKFGLLIFGLVYAVVGGLWPRSVNTGTQLHK
jgi:hypothetical protein